MMLLSGVIEMPCRIISGVIADRHYMTAFHQVIICIFGTGLMEMLCAAISGLPGEITHFKLNLKKYLPGAIMTTAECLKHGSCPLLK